jgi:hypothetical protein
MDHLDDLGLGVSLGPHAPEGGTEGVPRRSRIRTRAARGLKKCCVTAAWSPAEPHRGAVVMLTWRSTAMLVMTSMLKLPTPSTGAGSSQWLLAQ